MKKLGLVLLVCFSSVTAFSQKYVDDQTGWSFKDRGYLGLGFGGLGLGRSNVYGNYFFNRCDTPRRLHADKKSFDRAGF